MNKFVEESTDIEHNLHNVEYSLKEARGIFNRLIAETFLQNKNLDISSDLNIITKNLYKVNRELESTILILNR